MGPLRLERERSTSTRLRPSFVWGPKSLPGVTKRCQSLMARWRTSDRDRKVTLQAPR